MERGLAGRARQYLERIGSALERKIVGEKVQTPPIADCYDSEIPLQDIKQPSNETIDLLICNLAQNSFQMKGLNEKSTEYAQLEGQNRVLKYLIDASIVGQSTIKITTDKEGHLGKQTDFKLKTLNGMDILEFLHEYKKVFRCCLIAQYLTGTPYNKTSF